MTKGGVTVDLSPAIKQRTSAVCVNLGTHTALVPQRSPSHHAAAQHGDLFSPHALQMVGRRR